MLHYFFLVLKGPVLRTACGPETGPETGPKRNGLSVPVLVFENQGPIKKPVKDRFL